MIDNNPIICYNTGKTETIDSNIQAAFLALSNENRRKALDYITKLLTTQKGAARHD